jgi:hypothetical protein
MEPRLTIRPHWRNVTQPSRNQELDGLKQSMATTQDERTRLQLHSNEMTMSLVALRQELEESRAVANAARVYEEAGRQQLARLMDEQLAEIQTITPRCVRIKTSNSSTCACHRPVIFQRQQGGSLATLPLFHLFKLHRQGCAQESYMARDIIMWVHRRTRDMLNR